MPEDLAVIFAYHFLPENTIGAVRPFRFYKYLSRSGYRCHVISAADVTQLPGIDAAYIPDPFITKPREGAGWQLERLLRRFLLPGVTGTQWAVRAYRAAAELIEQNPQYRVTLFSTFPPVGSHLPAYWLARRKKLPWIADFRDPLAGNLDYAGIGRFPSYLYERLEAILVRAADFVIANTDAAQEKLRRSYPDRADRIQLIWNGFDPEERLPPLPVMPAGRKVISHVGELYGGRSVSPILQSLRRLIDNRQLSKSEFQIYLAGPLVEDSVPDPAFMAQAEQEGWVKLERNRMPRNEAHRVIQSSHALLLVQPQTSIQVPGKLFEYLQTGRPILAFVPADSPVERILRKSGVPYQCIYPSEDPQQLDQSMLRFFRINGAEAQPSEWFETEFNARGHAEKVGDLIQLANRERAVMK